MPYIQITILATPDDADTLADALTELDALAVTLEDAKDTPVFQAEPDESPLWQEVKVKALFPDSISPRLVMNNLKMLLGVADPINYRIEKIADQDWVRLTQQHFKPQCYADKLWVCPSWDEAQHEGIIMRIDPGLAFGTGTHPTTNLCLEWLAAHDLKNKTIVDYGCGSGILGLAAVMLGASHVYATDHDEQALIATNNNAALNANINTNNLTTCYPDDMPQITADIVVANILANPLISLEPTLAALLTSGGTIVLSGILETEIQTIAHAYQQNFKLDAIETRDEWACLMMTVRSNLLKPA